MDKMNQELTRFLNPDVAVEYPDFDAMWSRLEPNLPEPGTKLTPVDMKAPGQKQMRKAVVISSVAVILLATPVVATVTYRWDDILFHRDGIQTALQQGLGQTIEKSVTHEGVTLTVHTAIVDDNRTVLLYSLTTKDGSTDGVHLINVEKMELVDGQGRIIVGWHHLYWDEESKSWRGYFETEWTPSGPAADVRFIAHSFHSLKAVERDLPLNPLEGKTQTHDILQDGIGQLTVQPFVQGDNMLLAFAIGLNEFEAGQWVRPNIGVYHGNTPVKDAGPGVFGDPNERGEYTGQQIFRLSDLQQDQVTYKLVYNKEVRRVNADWTYNLHLDKQRMQSGTVKRDLNIPLEYQGKRLTLTQLIITPTQIRIQTNLQQNERFPFQDYYVEVNGVTSHKGMWNHYNAKIDEPSLRFEIPRGVHVNEKTPITFVAKPETAEYNDAKEPIYLKEISEEKKSVTTQVGGYSVKWTYYRKDGNLFVQSECENPSFGGINQTYMQNGETITPAKQMTPNFLWDGNNQAIDMYPNFSGKHAEIYIYRYSTDYPHKELRVELNR